jgi:ribosomal-protein-alanine N-acetyltransferase
MTNSTINLKFAENFPILLTSRLLLRQLTESDLPHVFEGLSHPEVIKYYGVSYHTIESTMEQMNWFSTLEINGTGIWWAVCSLDNGEFLGAGGFNDWSQVHRHAEIGFWLLPQAWGKGYMQEAMPALFNFGFDQMNLNRIEGFVESKNDNCIKAIKKLGFVHEGTRRECEVKNGGFISLDIYALLERDQRV